VMVTAAAAVMAVAAALEPGDRLVLEDERV
jgi:hypothetical protein